MKILGKRKTSDKLIRPWRKAENHERSSYKAETSASSCSQHLDDHFSLDGLSGASTPNTASSAYESQLCSVDNMSSSADGATVSDNPEISGMAKQAVKAVADFETRARKLLRFHHASHLEKLLLTLRYKFARSHKATVTEGGNLINYASNNANQIQNLLQRCQKGKLSTDENVYKKQLQAMRVRFLRSRWLIELVALYLNSNLSTASSHIALLPGIPSFSIESDAGKYSITFSLTDYLKIELDLTCPVCLETVFEPVSLSCGHLFCFSCACDAASIFPLEGLEAACDTSKCPICRKKGVYADALHLKGLNILIKNRCREQWEERRRTERNRRLQQAKEYWNGQMATIMAR